jgi:peptidoglycan/LPS O-acetylase OafA/YrhL
MSARTRHAGGVVLLAIAGLALAVALALLTSHLTTQPIGLAGEPSRPAPGLVAPAPARPSRTAPQPAPATTPAATTPTHADNSSGDDGSADD